MDIIGANVLVDVYDYKNIPAKVDTGADSSSIMASNINLSDDGELSFSLFNKESPFYDGKIITTRDYETVTVRSSNGIAEERYATHISTYINGRKIKVFYTLANRNKNKFPILIGRKTLRNKFIVNVAIKDKSISL